MSTYTGDMIRKYRTEKGLTQKKLGELCGIADSAIRRYEAGNANPKIETLRKIAHALQIDPYKLMDFGDEYEELVNLYSEITNNATDILSDQLTRLRKTIMEFDKNDIFTHIPEENLLYYFWALNKNGQENAIEQVELLAKIPEYRKEDK